MRLGSGIRLLALPLVAVLMAACGAANAASDVRVYTGYADNLQTVGVRSNPANFPSPWKGDRNVEFKGSGDKFDAGAIRIENPGGDQVKVDRVTVDIGPQHYDLWGSGLTAPANGSLILTQTEMGPENAPKPNFDTSEPISASGGTATAQGSSAVAVIHVVINGHTADYRDEGRILTTGGLDKGDLAGAPNESHGWQLLAAPGGATQGGLSPQLIFAPLAAMMLAFFSFIPRLIGALILLAIGWLLAGVVARLVAGLLDRVGLGAAAERTGMLGFLAGSHRRDGRGSAAARLFGQIAKWFVFLIFVAMAAEALGLAQVSALVHRIVLWIPNLVVALLIVVLGMLAAQFLGRVTRGAAATSGRRNASLLGTIVEYGVIALAAVVALTQLGIGSLIVEILFAGVIFALALAFGLAFGLGGRDVTSRIWRSARPSGAALPATSSPNEPRAFETTTTTSSRRPRNQGGA